jgi:serine/threonine-protein kinase
MSSWGVRGYTEGRELGRGASGRVVEATSQATGQRVAIKYLSATLVRDPEYMARFREEARLLTELEVPQVVQLLAYVENPGAGAAIVMELVDGVSLHEMISRLGPTGPESALAVLKGSLLGLAAAHSLGIVHRDYKPENVLVDAAGASKLADFGVAVRAGRRAPAAGTPLYMAPEQWAGRPASPAADIYAATAVFYECLTGRTPFSGRLRQLRRQHERAAVPSAEVDEPLRPLVELGLAKDPGARPANAATFVAELEATAAAAYGSDWERRGYAQLAARASALLLLLLGGQSVAGSAPGTHVVTWSLRPKTRFVRPKTGFVRRKRAVQAAAAVIVAAAAALAGPPRAAPSSCRWCSRPRPPRHRRPRRDPARDRRRSRTAPP